VKSEITFFNPTFGLFHILPKFGLKQPSIVYSAAMKGIIIKIIANKCLKYLTSL